MTYFLRSQRNNTIVCVELYKKKEGESNYIDISTVVVIKEYSKFLLENIELKDSIIEDFDMLDELRGWLLESYFMGSKNRIEEYKNVAKALKEKLQAIATKYSLFVVTD
jgi:hypothetical protein